MEIINRIALSPLITFDLADYHDLGDRVEIDIAPQLFQGMILREKDFRAYLAEVDWSIFADKHVNFYCSADAVIPGWAWLLLGIALEPYARTLVYGRAEDLEKEIWRKVLERIDFTTFEGKKIVVKGCGDIEIPQATFVELIRRLRPVANKLMYGEPCSTVPLYRKSKN